jgi:hypothetical protein
VVVVVEKGALLTPPNLNCSMAVIRGKRTLLQCTARHTTISIQVLRLWWQEVGFFLWFAHTYINNQNVIILQEYLM